MTEWIAEMGKAGVFGRFGESNSIEILEDWMRIANVAGHRLDWPAATRELLPPTQPSVPPGL